MEFRSLRPGKPLGRAELAEALNRHFMGDDEPLPYDQCASIVVRQLEQKWSGKFDSDDVVNILGDFWQAGANHTPDRGNPVNLLIKVALNYMRCKHRRRGPLFVDPASRCLDSATHHDIDDRLDAPTKDDVNEALGHTTKLRAQAYRLKEAGLSEGQIARLLGAPRPTVTSRVRLATQDVGAYLASKIGSKHDNL